MRSLGRAVVRLIHIVSKLFLLRAYAVGPITREREVEIRKFMATEPALWGHERRRQ